MCACKCVCVCVCVFYGKANVTTLLGVVFPVLISPSLLLLLLLTQEWRWSDHESHRYGARARISHGE